jgi:hypothetical protein
LGRGNAQTGYLFDVCSGILGAVRPEEAPGPPKTIDPNDEHTFDADSFVALNDSDVTVKLSIHGVVPRAAGG